MFGLTVYFGATDQRFSMFYKSDAGCNDAIIKLSESMANNQAVTIDDDFGHVLFSGNIHSFVKTWIPAEHDANEELHMLKTRADAALQNRLASMSRLASAIAAPNGLALPGNAA